MLLLALGVGCTSQPTPQSRGLHVAPAPQRPTSDAPVEGAPGLVVSLPIPPGFDREVRYHLSHCRANCKALDSTSVDLDVRLALERPNDCKIPDPDRPEFEDLEPSPDEAEEFEDPAPDDDGRPRDEILEYRAVELLGMKGKLLSRRSGAGLRFDAGASGALEDWEGERRRPCLSVHFSPYPSDPDAASTFRAVLSSLSSARSAAPPSGYRRFPFATGKVDLPDGIAFEWIHFYGRSGALEFKSYARWSERRLDRELLRNSPNEEPEVVDPHSSEPFLDGTIERASARTTVSKGELRMAVIRRPGRNVLIYSARINAAPKDGDRLDDTRWGSLVEQMTPLFHR